MISKKLTVFDVAFIVIASLAAVLLLAFKLIPSGENLFLVVISNEGEQSFSLSENRDIELSSNGINVKVRIEDGSAFIAGSECPRGICLKAPRAKNDGDSVVCAPAGVALIVKGSGGEADADAYAG